jgi:hypothetical protein
MRQVVTVGLDIAKNGLFAKGKFCLIRRGKLVLPRCRARLGADSLLPEAGGAVPRGSRPLGVGHEAAAMDGPAAAGRPSGPQRRWDRAYQLLL